MALRESVDSQGFWTRQHDTEEPSSGGGGDVVGRELPNPSQDVARLARNAVTSTR